MGFMTVIKNESVCFFYPFNTIFHSVEAFSHEAETLANNFHVPNLQLDTTAILLPIRKDRNVKLKPDYWNEPSIPYSIDSRVVLLIDAVRYFRFYSLLVTPWSIKQRAPLFAAAVPFYAHAPDERIEHFLRTSDFPVDESANNAALYSLLQPVGINWMTGESIPHVTVTRSVSVH